MAARLEPEAAMKATPAPAWVILDVDPNSNTLSVVPAASQADQSEGNVGAAASKACTA